MAKIIPHLPNIRRLNVFYLSSRGYFCKQSPYNSLFFHIQLGTLLKRYERERRMSWMKAPCSGPKVVILYVFYGMKTSAGKVVTINRWAGVLLNSDTCGQHMQCSFHDFEHWKKFINCREQWCLQLFLRMSKLLKTVFDDIQIQKKHSQVAVAAVETSESKFSCFSAASKSLQSKASRRPGTLSINCTMTSCTIPNFVFAFWMRDPPKRRSEFITVFTNLTNVLRRM